MDFTTETFFMCRKQSPRTSYAPLSRAILALFGLFLSYCLYTGSRAAYFEYREYFTRPAHAELLVQAEYPELELQLVALNSADDAAFKAYFVEPQNGALIILIHGSEGNRSQLLPEAQIFVRLGFGILSLDLPGHGESLGKSSWGDPEQKAVRSAIDWLQARPANDGWKIGVLGFSMGAWTALIAASHDSRIAALCLTGAFARYEEVLTYVSGKKRWLVYGPKFIVNYLFGLHYWKYRPADLINKVTRPILIVAGDQDSIVPHRMSESLYSAAKQPKQFFLIQNAGHGDYVRVAGDFYSQVLGNFFESMLLDKPSVAH